MAGRDGHLRDGTVPGDAAGRAFGPAGAAPEGAPVRLRVLAPDLGPAGGTRPATDRSVGAVCRRAVDAGGLSGRRGRALRIVRAADGGRPEAGPVELPQ